MSQVKISGNSSGTAVFEIAAPSSNTSRTQTLPDATGTVVLDSATQTLTNKTLTTPNINSAQFATVTGTAPIYPCRAWVNFDGTDAFAPNPSTTAIRASGNVTSITDNATGDYTVNFTTAMPDANYAVLGTAMRPVVSYDGDLVMPYNDPTYTNTYTTTSVRVRISAASAGTAQDPIACNIAVFR